MQKYDFIIENLVEDDGNGFESTSRISQERIEFYAESFHEVLLHDKLLSTDALNVFLATWSKIGYVGLCNTAKNATNGKVSYFSLLNMLCGINLEEQRLMEIDGEWDIHCIKKNIKDIQQIRFDKAKDYINSMQAKCKENLELLPEKDFLRWADEEYDIGITEWGIEQATIQCPKACNTRKNAIKECFMLIVKYRVMNDNKYWDTEAEQKISSKSLDELMSLAKYMEDEPLFTFHNGFVDSGNDEYYYRESYWFKPVSSTENRVTVITGRDSKSY